MSLKSNMQNQKDDARTEYIEALYRYAMVLTHDPTAAEDLVQETYVRAIFAVGRLRSCSNVKTWLYIMLRNVWFNERHRRAQPRLVEIDNDGRAANLIAEIRGRGCPTLLITTSIDLELR
jgi:RNA polymerase sigma-70 factor, ECF subfamily